VEGNKNMTVAELIAHLSTLPADSRVYVEQQGEHRLLLSTDIVSGPTTIYDADEGDVEDSEDGAVVITTWS
jgi:hypothetical protein